MMRDYYVTPSGTTTDIIFVGQGRETKEDAVYVSLNLSSTSFSEVPVKVVFTTPALIRVAVQQ